MKFKQIQGTSNIKQKEDTSAINNPGDFFPLVKNSTICTETIFTLCVHKNWADQLKRGENQEGSILSQCLQSY